MIDSEMVNSLVSGQLDAEEFHKAFIGAISGEETILSQFVRGPFSRPPSHEWRVIRERIFARDNYTCGYCGSRGVNLECDHILPVAKGGGHDDENLLTACKPCNRTKAGKFLADWLGRQG